MPQLEVPGGDAGGETIHYQRAGSGAKVIVLVHGFGADARSWTMNQPALAAAATVYALDLPGHGASPARDIGGLDRMAGIVAEAIAALTPEPVHLVGHSMGGAISLRVAELTPAAVRALTLIAPAGVGSGRNIGFMPAYMAMEDEPSAEHALRMLFNHPALINRQTIEGVLASRREPHIYAAWQAMRLVGGEVWARPAAARAALAALSIPVQILWGERDAVLPPEGLDMLPPNVRLHRIPDAGHAAHMEAAKTVNRLILEFDALA
ncbi:alpha/beta fold hydrolase [Acidisoma sp.]|uniref:alpha/beta fold hydrolase n=1 Tax=Acidisoma sp. TaxID=1872115 RepID=UPI003B00228C